MTKEENSDMTRFALSVRMRSTVKAVVEQVIEEEFTEHVGGTAPGENRCEDGTSSRRFVRRRAQRLVPPQPHPTIGKIEQLRVPRGHGGSFTSEVLEEYSRLTGEVEDAILGMWLQCISQRKIAEVTRKLGAERIGKDAASRIAGRLESEQSAFRKGRLKQTCPYLY